MDKIEFDEIVHKQFEQKTIEYGIIRGNDTVFFAKAGANGSMRGYEDKYVSMGSTLHRKYGYTIVCSSNPIGTEESLGQGIEVIEQFVKQPYQVYYFGHSSGALIGGRNAWKYPQIKRLVLVNGPLMINWHKTREGIDKFKGEKMVYIYGEEDPSFKFAGLVNLVGNPAVSLITVPKADHNFYGMLDEFEELPKYLLDERG